MPVEVYYYENSYTLRGTKFIKNGTKLQEKLGQIVYNKFRPANCSHGYEVPIWIPFHIRSASKFKNDRQVPAGGALPREAGMPLNRLVHGFSLHENQQRCA